MPLYRPSGAEAFFPLKLNSPVFSFVEVVYNQKGDIMFTETFFKIIAPIPV